MWKIPRERIIKMSALSQLTGRHITSAEDVHDYLQLKFDNGDLLSVFNEFVLESGDTPTPSDLVGLRVGAVSEDADRIRISAGDNTLTISLSDAAFRGPEALEFISSVGSRVVW